jgi:sialate O-acetylesterase
MALLGLALSCLQLNARAEVRLPALFSENMVLQRQQEVPVWGWADPGEKVTVEVAGQTSSTTADAEGRWKVQLAPLQTTDDHAPVTLVVRGASGTKLVIENVLIGEVWLCSGQSNMVWWLKRADHAEQEIAAADYPQIRFFIVPNVTAEAPKDNVSAQWAVTRPSVAGEFSATAYFFGRYLHKKLGVPVGLIQSAWGGTPVEAWISRPALESRPALKPLLKRWDESVAGFDAQQAKARFEHALARWEEAAKKAKAAGKQPPRRPRPAGNPAHSPHRPANLFNGMIAPLVPYAIRGAIWYQGESNVRRAYQYRVLMPALIENWRRLWGEGDFPFGIVQIAPFDYQRIWQIDPACCAELWEAQMLTAANVPNTGIAGTMDVGELDDIHPGNKQDVGRRLGLWARATVYGDDVVYSGPVFKSMAVEGGTIRVRFEHIGGGLTTLDGKPPTEFTVAGADGRFHPAEAVIDGNTVVLSSNKVAAPKHVRFAWRDTAQPNLANEEGLPAMPFRTDEQTPVTFGAE